MKFYNESIYNLTEKYNNPDFSLIIKDKPLTRYFNNASEYYGLLYYVDSNNKTIYISPKDSEKIKITELASLCINKYKSITLDGLIILQDADMSNIFENCESLEYLDVSKMDTTNISNMTNMFTSCKFD